MNSDLSQFHQPVSKLFPKLKRSDWEQFALEPDQIAFFRENGYLANIRLLDDAQVTQLATELEEIKDPSHPLHHLFYEFHSNESSNPNAVLFHSLGHWRITEGFHDVLWNPAFVVVASQLLGNKAVRFWHDQLFSKPAHHGGVVAWHQDYSYWTRTTPMQHLTCWIGLDDANRENGCLCYIPGSHKWGLLDKPELAGDMDGLERFLNNDQKKQFANKVFIEMKKGHGSFHHPLLVHGSYENKSPRSRRAFVINVFAEGTVSDSNDTLLEGVPAISKGNKMEGQFFPLLGDPLAIY
ncbi:phytanoyl-CoA dioxygenase family protein [Chryseolinea sp. T2]|uniref:phytanoyl-CoA dioxygenase family protein n=1 Tax=Chryseolinea sp. T2 TaxID=3129255 RepID=UPI003077D7A2